MEIGKSTQIRKLSPSHKLQLGQILDYADSWKQLMCIIPEKLLADNFACEITGDNKALYNSNDIRLIENASKMYHRYGAELLIQEWGCTGRILPTLGHLEYLLCKLRLFRAADYISVNILNQSPVKRPENTPEAPIATNLDENKYIEQVLNEIDYSSSVFENISNNTFDVNLDHEKSKKVVKRVTIMPQIFVTDADEEARNSVQNKEVSDMMKFSSNIQNDEQSIENNESYVESVVESMPDNLPHFSAILPKTESSENISSSLSSASEENSTENITENVSEDVSEKINNNSQNNTNMDVLPDFSILKINEPPNLSIFNNQNTVDISENETVSECNANIPNLSALLGTSENNPSNESSIDNTSCDTEINNSELMTANSNILPSFGTLNPELNISLATTHDNSSISPEITLPPLDANRRTSLNLPTLLTNSSKMSQTSIKSRHCTSPLPNLSLNTMLPHFTYGELEVATNNFNEGFFNGTEGVGRFLGKGAFGSVFLGLGLLDKPVAVKTLHLENEEVVNEEDQVTKQFKNEIEILSKYKHDNLLSLLGYSCDGKTYCLLYEYISGGALKDRLQKKDDPLFWIERLEIALGTSKAIAYLHSFSTPLIHRDIKTANILLDVSNRPKLCDFGLIKLTPSQNTNTTTAVFGTSAYMAPEAFRGDISVKIDTFSFGVVLLELLTSLAPFDKCREGWDLITHIEDHCEDSIKPLLDQGAGSWCLNNVDFGDELYSIALKCLEEKRTRPTMVSVREKLNELFNKTIL